MTKQELIEALLNGGCPQEVIDYFKKAKSWSNEERVQFVGWATERIQYLSSQPFLDDAGKKVFSTAKLQYELYLTCLNENVM